MYYKNSKNHQGFTLIELLVVIAIVAILATLTTIALNGIRAKARDTLRIADIKQMRTALELYFSDENGYPTALAAGQPLVSLDGNKTYMARIPSNPAPRVEGACTEDADYLYIPKDSGAGYELRYCLAKNVNELPAGLAMATQHSIHQAVSGTACIPSCDGKCGGELDSCGQSACGAPSTPVLSGLNVSVSGLQVTLNWDAPSQSNTTYKIERSTDRGSTYTQVVAAHTSNSYVDAGCTNGLMCRYRVTPSLCSSAGEAVATTFDAIPTPGQACPSGATVADNDNANNNIVYNTVWIDINGNSTEDTGECWTKENLVTTKRPNGTALTSGTTGDYSCPPNTAASAADCSRSINGNNSMLGYLYSWAAAMDMASSCNGNSGCTINSPHRGLCPSGWHVPTDTEWYNIENFLKTSGQTCVASTYDTWQCSGAASAMKAVGTSLASYLPWKENNVDATNSSGLTLRGAGNYANPWSNPGTNSTFWTANQYPSTPITYAIYRNYGHDRGTTKRGGNVKAYLFAVRCVKN